MQKLLQALVDLIYPPRPGDPPVSPVRAALVLLGLAVAIVIIAMASR